MATVNILGSVFSGIGTKILEYIFKNFFNKRKTKQKTEEINNNKNFANIIGERISWLRKNKFQASKHIFANRIGLSVSELEGIESGKNDLPYHSIERLKNEYKISASFFDDEYKSDILLFEKIHRAEETISEYLSKGFKLYIITPPGGSDERIGLHCRLVIHKKRNRKEDIHFCFQLGTNASFLYDSGKRKLEYILTQYFLTNKTFSPPSLYPADLESWEALKKSCFYKKEISFPCSFYDDKCDAILSNMWDQIVFSNRIS